MTYTDTQTAELLFCVAVTGARRTGEGVEVSVLFVAAAARPVDLNGNERPDVILVYGAAGRVADQVGGAGLRGVVPPGARQTGVFVFDVPAGATPVTVTVGFGPGTSVAFQGNVG